VAELNLSLHPDQLEVFKSPERFKVIAAGRRWGKTHLAVVELLTKALEESATVNGRKRSLKGMECWYVAPTFQQATDICWNLIKTIADPIISKTWENDAKMLLANGRYIQLKGADRPDRLRGVGLSHVIMDEFASMKEETWSSILRPTLADVGGSATFIGTPLGKNHFYDLYQHASTAEQWGAWHFESQSNPYLPKEEVAAAKATMPREIFQQEFEASFEQSNKLIFPYDVIEVRKDDVPADAIVHIAVDPAGFSTDSGTRHKYSKLDQTAIAVVAVNPSGWWVLDVVAGRWDVRETSLHILRECQKHRPVSVGIEGGMARNAILPYLQDQMRRMNVYPNLIEVKHGGKDKTSRIAWALQGRMEHGRIHFVDGDYLPGLKEQLWDFPFGRHDDMVDALAYIDQLAMVTYRTDMVQDTWEPLDAAVGL
jgi:phage terminase large subunit-like protein